MERYYKHKIENLININKIVTIHYMECQNDFKVPGEKHDFWELLYLDKGHIFVTADGETKEMYEGDIIFHIPNEFHAVKADGKLAPNLFIISFECNSPALNILQKKCFKLPSNLKHFITDILNEGYSTFYLADFNPNLKKLEVLKNPVLGGQQMIITYLQQFLILIIRDILEKQSYSSFYMTNEEVNNNIVKNIIKLLKDNISNNLTMEEICENLNYGKTYLSKTFKQYTNKTIMHYYTEIKMKKAKQLLREHNLNCTEISNFLCYDSPAHFSNTFKKYTKMSPSQYIKSTSSEKKG